MTPPDSNDDHLADLRRRWEEDPGSRIFLQLAEEYRRAGRNEEALEVLEKGMETHPSQVSGLVSLGRIHLALDQPGKAAEALEKAVEIDPTNPMAMKLATEAHLQAGDRAMAKQRLDLYKLLNAGDEDTESLEARVEGRLPASDAPQPEPPEDAEFTEPAAEAAEADAPDGDDAAPAGSWSPTAAWPSLPQGGATGTGAGSPSVEPSEAADAVAGGYASEFRDSEIHTSDSPYSDYGGAAGREAADDDRPEPFADLLSEDGEGEYLSGLAAEGIFPVEEKALGEEAAEEEEAAAGDGAAPDEEDPFPELSTPQDVDTDESPWDVVDEDTLVLPEEELAASPAADEAVDSGPRPTVTLGHLYLDQGHHAEALAIFDAVLERDPGHEAAAAGRRAALAQQEGEAESGEDAPGEAPATAPAPVGFSLEAGELLRGADPSKPRKVALLEAYLDRIRGERAS